MITYAPDGMAGGTAPAFTHEKADALLSSVLASYREERSRADRQRKMREHFQPERMSGFCAT